MEKLFSSMLIGLFFTVLTFGVCLVVVVCARLAFIALKNHFAPLPEPIEDPKPAPPKKRRTYKPIRSIEINPEEVDRIYVKKSS